MVRVDGEFSACKGVFVPEGKFCAKNFGGAGEELGGVAVVVSGLMLQLGKMGMDAGWLAMGGLP